MFTGLVEERGTLAARALHGPSARLTVRCAMGPLALGESISIDGVCLTVDKILAGSQGFEAEATAETLARTTLGSVDVSGAVNLERAVPLGGRMGGHIVTGHVDAVGMLLERTSVGSAVKMVFGFPIALGRYIAEKGSICVSGVSLTVNGVSDDRFDVVVIPHTLGVTSLDALVPSSSSSSSASAPSSRRGGVNLEVDILARYILRARQVDADVNAKASAETASSNDEWRARLARNGYT